MPIWGCPPKAMLSFLFCLVSAVQECECGVWSCVEKPLWQQEIFTNVCLLLQ
eukprot:m.21247 g.21247  ORF g.21247 m.21247 type:complete len:52 (-) comp8264_c0_seq1:168-323(-)